MFSSYCIPKRFCTLNWKEMGKKEDFRNIFDGLVHRANY